MDLHVVFLSASSILFGASAQHDTFRGRNYCIRPGEFVRDLHQSQWSFGDTISSVRRLNTASRAGFPVFFG